MLLNSNPVHPLTKKLCDWYAVHQRDLPWRKNPSPYHIWLSEIVFQQTRIDQGLAYYDRLIAKFPTIKELADSEERELLKLWEGLGYYSRARNLHFSAKKIMNEHGGVFPNNYAEILDLKGVGPYTAAAISSIAFSLAVPAIDGNVLRVVSRLYLIKEPIDVRPTYKLIERELTELMDKNQPGDFNQAMMELGALICKPQNPLCEMCPVSEHCLAFERKEQDKVPVKKGKVKVKKVHFNYMVFHTEEELLIEKRNSGIWRGLYQFPLMESDLKMERKDVYDQIRVLGFHDSLRSIESEEYKHILSHRIIYARFYLIEVTNLDQIKGYLRISKSAIEQYPLPQLIVKFLSSKSAKQNLMYIVD